MAAQTPLQGALEEMRAMFEHVRDRLDVRERDVFLSILAARVAREHRLRLEREWRAAA